MGFVGLWITISEPSPIPMVYPTHNHVGYSYPCFSLIAMSTLAINPKGHNWSVWTHSEIVPWSAYERCFILLWAVVIWDVGNDSRQRNSLVDATKWRRCLKWTLPSISAGEAVRGAHCSLTQFLHEVYQLAVHMSIFAFSILQMHLLSVSEINMHVSISRFAC